MKRWFAPMALGTVLIAGVALAQDQGQAAVLASVQAFTDAVNREDIPAALSHFTANPSIIEDLAPYRFAGPEAGANWIKAMGDNAEAHGVTGIEMKLSPATRVDVSADRAYAIVPGLLTFTMKAGRRQTAAGTLTFALQRSDAGWKIDAFTWTGMSPK